MSEDKAVTQDSKYLVVVGSSAGGIEALSILVSTLRQDFPAPIVLAQHLDPHRPSYLGTILERRSALPIVVVQGSTALEPGKVYVVPSNRHVTIRDGHVELEDDHGSRPRPSVDLLLSTAAMSYGEHLVAVILTGSGSDGAAGAVDVKQAGGTVIIQNPHTARYPGMPMALPPTAVDHVADIEEIGLLLNDLIKGVTRIEPEEKPDDALRDILTIVSRQANIDFRSYKSSTILRRIARRMAVTHNYLIRDYVRYLEGHSEEVGELVMALLIKVTEFFRDPDAFHYIKHELLPKMIEQGRARGRVLRFWSAGCATGEEPYSLALLLADHLGVELSEWNVKIFATDLDEGAIDFARRGLYPTNMLRELPDAYRARFFEPIDHGHRISKALRQMLIFGQQDLSRGVPFPRMDMVLCRNLLIYFQPELQQEILDRFAYSLHQSHGYLFLGKAETARPSKASYDLVSKKWKVYRCARGPVPTTFRPVASVGAPDPGRQPTVRRAGALDTPLANGEAAPYETEVLQLRRYNEVVFRFVATGIVVIDRAYHIMTINAAARRLLGVREIINEQDFLHTVRGLPYAQVRNAIDTAFREHTTTSLIDIAFEAPVVNEGRYFTLTIVPVQAEGGLPELVAITVNETTEQVRVRQQLETAQSEQKQLLNEVGGANKRLSEMNKELLDTNEELQAANEELMLAQEELQATNEEFEATNEELQATNEELETNNEEMQAANEELETTNDELSARTSELQDLTKSLASERVRLAEMVELAPFYILVLRGPGLLVDAFNPRYARLFEGREVIGLPLNDVFPDADLADLVALAHEAYKQDQAQATPPMRVTAPDERGNPGERYFVYTIVPSHDGTGKVDGIVIYAEDVSEQMAREAEERRAELTLMVENAHQVALGLYDAQTAQLLRASPRYLDMLERAHGYARHEIIGRKYEELAFAVPHEQANELFRSVCESRTPRHMPEVGVTLSTGKRETMWDWTLTPIVAKGGGPKDAMRFVVMSAVEITEQVRARENLEEIDRIKDEFLSLASHELRTPLVPIIGYADMLGQMIAQKRQKKEPGWDKDLDEITNLFRKKLRHLNRLIDDLFDVTRLQSGKFSFEKKSVDLASVLQQAIKEARLFNSQYTIHFAGPETAEPLVVSGDEERLIQVMSNLLQNAIQHSTRLERIDVRLSRVPGSDGAADQAQIEVQDYGSGIAAEDLSLLFTRFYQAAKGNRAGKSGLGLGLFICKAIVEQHGGVIAASSIIGKGSTFTIRLPLNQ